MNKLHTINAEDLQNRTYEPTYFLVDELIPEGLHILAGAPKIGKSWLALWLCLCVAQGQALWNFATSHGEVLYLSLEDSFQRIQTRLFDLTEDAPPTLHFAIMADTLKHGLEQQIEQFLTEHPATKLVVIDTLQRVRSAGSDSNLYANDYTGVLVNHRREYLGGKVRPVNETDWLRHENFYPVIIEKAIWQQAQTRLKQQARPAVNNRTKHRYAGLLTCQECGNVFSPMIRCWNGSRRVEYVCRGYHRNGKGYCSSHRIHEEILDKAVWDYTEKLREQYAAELKRSHSCKNSGH